jgi:glycosyltransferase involved in cell wall biosynthesis
MKYVFVVPSMPFGGAEKQISYLVNHINSKSPNQSGVVALLQGRPDDISFGLDIMQSDQPHKVIKAINRLFVFVGAYIKLFPVGKNFIFYNQLLLPLALALKISGKNVVFSIREYDERFYKGWRRYCLLKMNWVYTNTERVSNELTSMGCKVDYIRNFHAFDKEHLYKLTELSNIIKCVIVSNVEPHKHIHIAIKALEGLSCRLEVLGKCENQSYFEECKQLAHDLKIDVCFHGFVGGGDVKAALQTANLFLHPSSQEGTSNAILGAIDVAVPILVSDIPENISVVNSLDCTFRLGDAMNLNEKIIEALGRPIENTLQLRAYVKSRYSSGNLLKLHDALEDKCGKNAN